MILGGSPIRVAVPPTLEAKTSGISRAIGLILRVTAISMVTGMISSMVVTLSKKGRGEGRNEHQDGRQGKDVPPGQLEGLVGQPLKDPGLLQDPHDDHHGHEQEDDVHVHGVHGVFKGQDGVIGVEGPDRVGDEQEQGRPQQGRQGPVHELEGDEGVDQRAGPGWRSRRPG